MKIDDVELVVGDAVVFTEKWLYLSFADGDLPKGQQFLGAVILRAINEPGLVAATARAKGLNPGGEMLMFEITDKAVEKLHPKWTNRLLSKADLEEMDRALNR